MPSSPTSAAVAQHHDAVGAALDLVQPVRDEDDADAVGLEVGDDLEQPLGLRQRQARGRLVHDDQPRFERQRLGDLDQLPLGERQVGDRRVGREVDAEPLEQRRDHRRAARRGRPAAAARRAAARGR